MTGSKTKSSNSYARDNSQRRRNEEAYWFSKLSECLPFPVTAVSKLDKGKLLRLAINYIRMKKYTKQGSDDLIASVALRNGYHGTERLKSLHESNLMLDALGGFLIFINRKGVIYYVSEHVNRYLGTEQADLIGRNVFEHLHAEDHIELLRQTHEHPTCRNSISCQTSVASSKQNWKKLEEEEDDDEDELVNPAHYIRERLFSVRMKCHMPRKKGNTTKQTGFSLMQWSGRMKLEVVRQHCCRVVGLVALCRPMSVPIVEIRMQGNMFTSRHGLDMRFTYCDARIFNLIGYKPRELIGKTAYQFHNPQDAPKIHNCHTSLIDKGTSVSKYYRFLGKTGVWVWMQTRATIITNADSSRYIICMNFIIGEEEGRRCLQMEQEEKGLKACTADGTPDDNAAGAIDITAINSPVSAHSSGYSSADDENLISPNNSSQFSPFSPDEDFPAISFGGNFDAGHNVLDQIGSQLPPTSGALSGQKESAMHGFPLLSMSPMHNPNFDDIIDLDAIIDPLATFSMPHASQPQSLLAVSSSPSTMGSAMSETPTSTSMAAMVTSTQSQLSPRNGTARVSLANSSVTMNCNFDNDVEMIEPEPMDTSSSTMSSGNTSTNDSSSTNTDSTDSDSSNHSVTSNITINLPPGFNPKGQDGKSVLLDVLRKADKSQLLKIHEQINAAMASISQSRSNGKAAPAPELQISITPASSSGSPSPKSTATTMSTSPIFSSMMNSGNILSNNRNGAKQTTNGAHHENGSLADARVSPMDITSSSGGSVDNVSSMFTDVDSQLPGFDILDTNPAVFSESLLNDVNLGAPVSVAIPQNNNTQVPTSKVSTTHRTVAPRNGGTTPVMSSVVKPRPCVNNGSYVQQKQARTQSNMAVNKVSSPEQLNKGQSYVRNGAAVNGSHQEHVIDMAAAVRGLDDHSYTSKCPSRKNTEHVKFAPMAVEKGSYHRMKNAPVLEHLLTTKKPLNPMKGSDHVAQGMQQLALQDMESHHGLNQPNLLKKLLTGEMDKTRLDKPANASIYTRRGNNTIAAVSPTPATTQVQSQPAVAVSSAAGAMSLDTDYGFDEAAMLGSLDLLGSSVDIDSLWNSTSKDSGSAWNTSAKSDNEEIFGDIDELLQGETQSELDDILRQETRHEDEWMKQFLDGLL